MSIRITATAYEAIWATFPDVQRSPPAAEDGVFVKIWLKLHIIDRLKHLRGPGESYSDVILRVAKESQA